MDNNTKELNKVFGSRYAIESSVLMSMYNDTSLFDEWKLNEEDFKTTEGKLLFNIGELIRRKGVTKIDKTSLDVELTYHDDLKKDLSVYGGSKAVIKQMSYVSDENKELYYDNLLKNNYLMGLYDRGVDVVRYADKFKKMNYESAVAFVECDILNVDLDKGATMRGTEITDLFITDEARERYFNGDIVETISFHNTAPILNSMVNGLPLKAMTMISSPSGGSKSTFITYNFIYSALKQGERVVLITNEMLYQQYEAMLITMVAVDVFDEYSLTRDKLNKGVKNEKDREIFNKVMKYINDNFAKKLRVVFYTSGKKEVVIKTIRRESKLGCRMVVFDVLKVEDSRNSAWSELIEMSKALDFACKENNVALIVTNQLRQTAIEKRIPTRADLSEGKDMIKTVSNHVLFRWLHSDEFTGEKNDANFYTLRRDEETGKWKRVPIELKKQDNIHNRFLVAYIDKNRYGTDGEFILYKFEGRYGTYKEICCCKPVPDTNNFKS